MFTKLRQALGPDSASVCLSHVPAFERTESGDYGMLAEVVIAVRCGVYCFKTNTRPRNPNCLVLGDPTDLLCLVMILSVEFPSPLLHLTCFCLYNICSLSSACH